MTDFNTPSSRSAVPDPGAVKEAFARCFAIEDPDERSAALDQLEHDNPLVAAEVRSLMAALQSSDKVEMVSAFVPMLDLSLASAPERLDELCDVPDAVDAANFSVLRSMQETVASVPQVVLMSSGEEEPVVKVRSLEIDQTWNLQDGRYRLDGEIARGGMGAIIKGRDTDLGRDLAIKVLLKEHQDNPSTIKRFIEEAQIGGQLQHPGIAPVYELGQFHDQRPFFTMKLIKGKTLAALLRERKTVEDERTKFLGIFEQICQTMAYAHSRGVLHRDLKPANVMVGAFGEVQVMDWGLAKVLAAGGIADERQQRIDEDVSLIETVRSTDSGSTRRGDTNTIDGSATRMGSIMGTPAYMSPEQAAGEVDHLDQRTDVFSLGSILCKILTGKPAYLRDKQMDPLVQARSGDLQNAFERLDASSADIELIQLAKDCLAIDRTERPSDAQAVTERISGYLESVDQRLRETELEVARSHTKAEEERKRRRVVIALAGSVVFAVLLGSTGWMWLKEKDAQLAQIKADAEIAAAAERSELEQQIQNAMVAAAALADGSEGIPGERELERAIEAIQRAQAATVDQGVSLKLISDLGELQSKVIRQQADLKLVERLREIWQTEQQYFAEKELPPIQDVRPSNKTAADSMGKESDRKVRDTLVSKDVGNPAALYERAFGEWGLRLGFVELPEPDILQSVERMTSTDRLSVIASLNRWRQLLDLEPTLADWARQRWSFLKPIELHSSRNDQFRVLSDQSILVSGPEPNQGHQITFETDATDISALRLEALLDESLPNNGPGRGPDGMFDLQGLRVRVAPRSAPEKLVTAEFSQGAADYADVNWPFQLSRWRTWGGGGHAHVAYFQFAETLYHPDGFRIEVLTERSVDSSLERGTLGRFRWSAARLEDPAATKASLDSLIVRLDADPWRKRLRKGLTNGDIGLLTQLASEGGAEQTQPSILLTTLATQLMSTTGANLQSVLPAQDEFETYRPKQVQGENGTQYILADDGTIAAKGPSPAAEITTLVLPPGELQKTTRLIRIELLGSNDDVVTSYIGRRRFVTIRELSVSQSSGGRARNVLQRIFSDLPFPFSLEKMVDGDLDTALTVPIPDNPRTLYLVLDQDSLSSEDPLEIKLYTGSENYFEHDNPARIRFAISSPNITFEDPFVAAEHLLTRLAGAPSLDPLVQLQLARYYESSIPARTDDAIRHAMAAIALLPDSIVPSLALIDLVKPSDLVGNAPLRQIVKEHLHRLSERDPEGTQTVRFRLALVASIIEKYGQGKFDEAEELIWFGLVSLDQDRKLMVQIFTGLPWDTLPLEQTVDSLSRGFHRPTARDQNANGVAGIYNLLGLLMRRNGQPELLLKLLDKAIDVLPDYMQAHHNRGSVLLELGRIDAAEKQFRRHIELDPTDPNPRSNLARVLFRKGDLKAAFAGFRKSAELFSELHRTGEIRDAPVRANQVNGYWLARQKSFWLEEIEAVLAGAEETMTEAREPIPTAHAVQAVEEGIAYLQQVVDAKPDSASDILGLAVAHFRIGQWQQAVDRLEQMEAMSAGVYDRDRWHLFLLSMAHWKLGNKQAALRYFGVGSAWVDRTKLGDFECERIRGEAASLLELDPIEQRQVKKEGFTLWLQELEQAISQEPTDYIRWFYRGKVHDLLGNNEQALADFSKAIDLEPLDPDLLGWRAGIYVRLRRWADSVADRTKAIELQPWFSARYFERADTHRNMGESHLALADIEEGLRVDSSIDPHWFSRTRARTMAGDICLLDLQELREAVRHYDLALELDPEYFMAFRGRAHAFWWLKQYPQALSDINQALAIQDEDAISFGIRAEIHLETGQFDQALDDRYRAVELEPKSNLRYFERARLHRFRKEFDLALRDIEKGLEVDPDGDISHFSRAHAHNLAGDIYLDDLDQPEKAIEQYETASQLDPSLAPNTPDSRVAARGHSLYELGRYEQAISLLTKAIESDPDNQDLASLLSRRAESYRQLNQLDLALDDCIHIVEREPDRNARYFERARVHSDRGDYQLAIEDIQKGLQVDPDREHRWFTRAKALVLAGDLYLQHLDQPQAALEHYERALKYYPRNPEYQQKCDQAKKVLTTSATVLSR